MNATPSAEPISLYRVIDGYEQCRAADPLVRYFDFLPPVHHSRYRDILVELIRVELEYDWKADSPRPLSDYLEAHPELVADRDARLAIAFEDYRLRQRFGQPKDWSDYADRYELSDRPPNGESAFDQWPTSSRGCDPVAPSSSGFPEIGARFLGFHLLAELGRGAFGRVFLARQEDLAHRFMVIKVSADIDQESRTLAQLVHTNIVPIYSFHKCGRLQAACMPFLGGTTFAHILAHLSREDRHPVSGKQLLSTIEANSQRSFLPGRSHLPITTLLPGSVLPETKPERESEVGVIPQKAMAGSTLILEMLERMSYVEAVLWIGERLADGLRHAHERQILHCDLKPANILLTDEGQPMLLDFNLAQPSLESEQRAIGGTIAYMAPEHLARAMGRHATLDQRSDLFSLGLILYQLFARRLPYPIPEPGTRLETILEERCRPVPPLRSFNPLVTPGVEAIVHRCLNPTPEHRYQNARELQEDLEQQRKYLPLRHTREPSWREWFAKWVRHHPRLTSSTTVASVAAAVLLLLVVAFVLRGQRLASAQARENHSAFLDEFRQAQFLLNTRTGDRESLRKGRVLAESALARYRVQGSGDWRTEANYRLLAEPIQEELRQDVGELLLLLARAEGRAGEIHNALAHANRALDCFAEDYAPAAVWHVRADLKEQLGQSDEARADRERAKAQPIRNGREAFLEGSRLAVGGQYREAIPLLERATRADARHFSAWFVLGYCNDNLARNPEAINAYTSAIVAWPDFPWTYFNRAIAHLRQRDYARSLDDLDEAIRRMPDESDAHVNRAIVRRYQNPPQLKEALADLDRALELGTAHTRVYFLRAQIRAQAGDRAGAKVDRDHGLALTPNDEDGFVARGVARMESDPKAALADMESALERNPWHFAALSNKAYLCAEKLPGRMPEALATLNRALTRYPDAVTLRASRGVYRARIGDRKRAHEDARDSLLRDTRPDTMYRVACIYALTARKKSDDRLEAVRLLALCLRQGYPSAQLLKTDPDLDPIRKTLAFRNLVEAAGTLQNRAGGDS